MEELMEKDEGIELLESFYSKAKYINSLLLKKSNSFSGYENAHFVEVYLFFISSHTMSLIKQILVHEVFSLSSLFNIRCIIEGYAFLKMYNNQEIEEYKLSLLNSQWKILEYNVYKSFPEFDKILFSLEDMKQKYTQASKEYELAQNNAENISKILRSNIPYLCKKHINYESIISKCLSEDELILYKTSSLLIHPHDYGEFKNEVIGEYLETIIGLLYKIYHQYNELHDIGLFEEMKLLNKSSGDSYSLFKLTNKQVKKLNKLSETFIDHFKSNFISNVIKEFSDIWLDITTDSLFGLHEQLKVKIKMIIEISALFYYIYFKTNNLEKSYKILKLHTIYKISKNMNIKNTKKILTEDFNDFGKEFFENQKSFENFFKNTIGFTVENKQINNISKLVALYIGENFKEKTMDNLEYSSIVKLLYKESQLLSHANGYMFFANSGIWADDLFVYHVVEKMILKILNQLEALFKLHRKIEKTNNYTNLIKDISSTKNYIMNRSKEKNIIQNKPRIDKEKYFEVMKKFSSQ
jgi:hypothetical protein